MDRKGERCVLIISSRLAPSLIKSFVRVFALVIAVLPSDRYSNGSQSRAEQAWRLSIVASDMDDLQAALGHLEYVFRIVLSRFLLM